MNGQQFQAPIPSTKSIEDAKVISGALDTLNKVSIKCKKANDAIMSGNKIRMWNVLQELINEYGDAINQNHRNTGKQVVFANINSHTIDQIKNQLIWMQRFIYRYETYADLCTISDEELKKWNITFKKIPRDIAKV